MSDLYGHFPRDFLLIRRPVHELIYADYMNKINVPLGYAAPNLALEFLCD